jgi:hypothetical protein
VVLIPKKDNPIKISDYRPISLSHSFAKIVTKLMANRVAPELEHLVSVNQTAFIKKRCIHDNFVYVQQVIKDLHRKKYPPSSSSLTFQKSSTLSTGHICDTSWNILDLAKNWRDWISSLWCTASSSFLLNGQPGKRIYHCRCVRQEDPSPLCSSC